WELESSIDLSQQVITNAILSGGRNLPVNGGFGGGFSAPADPGEDYLPVGTPPGSRPSGEGGVPSLVWSEGGLVDAAGEAGSPPDDASDAAGEGGVIDGAGTEAVVAGDGAAGDGAASATGNAEGPSGSPEPYQSADAVRAADLRTLFAGLSGPNVRVTRLRSDIAHATMTADLVLQASSDQSPLSNIRQATKSVNEQCPIYDGCRVVGQGSPAQASASQHRGCTTSVQRFADGHSAAGALAGIAGVFLARSIRRRRRARP
ncbi:MAG: hypothetical protein JOZ69_07275, partial [Myxococcales bacterium]|nr:hypothetical protein [Myxococcales bacterium]